MLTLNIDKRIKISRSVAKPERRKFEDASEDKTATPAFSGFKMSTRRRHSVISGEIVRVSFDVKKPKRKGKIKESPDF